MDFSGDWPPQPDAIPQTRPQRRLREVRPSRHLLRPRVQTVSLTEAVGGAGPGWAWRAGLWGGLQELGVRGFEKRLLGGGVWLPSKPRRALTERLVSPPPPQRCRSHEPLADVLGFPASQNCALSPPGARRPCLPSYLKPSADIQP